ncbi:MAG: hypothetical protein JNK38_28035 [Acidobacteria bacterium]|nr:hypothetical protein [Acidobacteriota bacterium]
MNLKTTEILDGLKDALSRAKLNLVEILALVLALVFAGAIVFYYFSKVQPLSSELSQLKAREAQIQLQIDKVNTDEKKRNEQAANAEAILASLKNFDLYLKQDERGMTEIINEIDSLGQKHGVLTGDSSYRVAEAEPLADESGQPAQQKRDDEDRKIYPSLGIDTNIIGEYPNLRRFLTDLERSKQFLIINAVNFQGESDAVRRAAQKSGSQKLQLSSNDAVPVSLKIEMDTYFQSPYKSLSKTTTSQLAAEGQSKKQEQATQKASTEEKQ